MSGYDLDAVNRFVNAAIKREPIDPDDAEAIAYCLVDLVNGDDPRRKLGLTRKPGERRKAFDPPNDATSPVSIIAMRVETGRITAKRAVEQLERVLPASKSTAERILRIARQSTREKAQGIDAFASLHQLTNPLDMHYPWE